MRSRAGPEHDVGPPEILWHILALEHAAIGDMPGDPRLAIANQVFADFRPHAVTADQRAALDGLAVVERDGDAVAVILECVNASARLQRDQVAAFAGLEECTMDV